MSHDPKSTASKYWTKGAVRFRADRTDPRHGTLNGYSNLGCRCRKCRETNTVAHLEYMTDNFEQQERNRLYMQTQRAAGRFKR